MSIARRAVLKLIGGSAAALPSAVRMAPGLLATSEPLVAAGVAASAIPEGPASATENVLGKALYKKLFGLRAQLDAEKWAAATLRINGLDPDLATLRSCSHSWKALKQMERLREEHSISWRLERTLWP